jgi:hypothetical protein
VLGGLAAGHSAVLNADEATLEGEASTGIQAPEQTSPEAADTAFDTSLVVAAEDASESPTAPATAEQTARARQTDSELFTTVCREVFREYGHLWLCRQWMENALQQIHRDRQPRRFHIKGSVQNRLATIPLTLGENLKSDEWVRDRNAKLAQAYADTQEAQRILEELRHGGNQRAFEIGRRTAERAMQSIQALGAYLPAVQYRDFLNQSPPPAKRHVESKKFDRHVLNVVMNHKVSDVERFQG